MYPAKVTGYGKNNQGSILSSNSNFFSFRVKAQSTKIMVFWDVIPM
jgi:hypothetical protein